MISRVADEPVRILVTGANGQVGWELQRSLEPLGSVVALDHAAFDLSRPEAMRATIRDLQPTVLVNAAAYTAVDRAESEPDLAMAINGLAPGVMAEEMSRLGGVLVHFSTDYVFDGIGYTPWKESDTPNPLGVYGCTKLAGEQAIGAVGAEHLILRTSWLYGRHGSNFVRTVIRLALERDELRIVADQIGAPTWSRELADWVADIVAQITSPEQATPDAHGVFHLAAGGSASWHQLAQAVVRYAPELAHRRHVTVVPIASHEYPLPAKRPAFSVFDISRARRVFGLDPMPWEIALTRCMCVG